MDHVVHLETSLLILPACACGTHADRCIHENTGFIAPSLAGNVQKEEGHMAHFRDIGEKGPTEPFYNSLPFSGLETWRDEMGHVAHFPP